MNGLCTCLGVGVGVPVHRQSAVKCAVLVVEMVRLVSWSRHVWLRCCKGDKITDLCNCRCEMVVRGCTDGGTEGEEVKDGSESKVGKQSRHGQVVDSMLTWDKRVC